MNNYESTSQHLKDINKECDDEDKTYKKLLHDREQKVAHFRKTKIKENNKYSESIAFKFTASHLSSNQTEVNTPQSKNRILSTGQATRSLSPYDSDGGHPIIDKLQKEMV